MVHETPVQMSAVKKLNLRRSVKSTFGRKSSKKTTAKLEAVESDDDSAVTAVTASPIAEENHGAVNSSGHRRRDSKERGKDSKSPFIISRGTTGKSYKWPFRNRRSEDNGNGNVKSAANRSLEDGASLSNEREPGSLVEGGDTGRDGPLACAQGSENQGKEPAAELALKHQFVGHRKGEGYVVPLHRHQQNPLPKKADDEAQRRGPHPIPCEESLSGVPAGTNSDGGPGKQDDSPRTGSEDPWSGSAATSLDASPKEDDDNMQRINAGRPPPQLPSPCSDSEPELPPRIPPKPASLRNRALYSAGASSNDPGGDDLDDEAPPRPPARPKNRLLGQGSVSLWDSRCDNRATVYETVSMEPREASLAKELGKLPRQPWYWGPLTQAQAEEKLAKLPDGNFLVRDSSDDRYLLSLSFNSHGRTLHSRIEHRNNLFSLNDSDGHSSVVELIACAVEESRRGVYGYMRDPMGMQSFPARLTEWVSRFTEMRSLQHLCRFLIREVYPRHHIQMLPLPKKIKEYILENQY